MEGKVKKVHTMRKGKFYDIKLDESDDEEEYEIVRKVPEDKMSKLNAPTIQEKIIGSPKPPRKPVFAGLTPSIASIPGSAVILIITANI